MSANPLNINLNFSRKSGLYRYSFNGKENENTSVQGAYDFGARIYDGRLGRWWSVDPKHHLTPIYSPYQFSANNPIFYIDHAGETITPYCLEIDKVNIEKDWDALFIKKNGDNVMASVLKASWNVDLAKYTEVSPKDFKKALRGLSSDQKAIARGYFKVINSQKDVTVRGISSTEQMTFKEMDAMCPSTEAYKNGIRKACGLAIDAPGFSLYQLGSPALTITNPSNNGLVLYATDRTLQRVDAVSIKDPFEQVGPTLDDQNYNLLKNSFATMTEGRVHEIIGHYGFDSGAINFDSDKGAEGSWLTAIQISNVVRRIEAKFEGKKGQTYEPRTGTDHMLSSASKDRITEIPNDLKK